MIKNVAVSPIAIGFALVSVTAFLSGCGPQPGPAPTAAPVTPQDQSVRDKIRDRRAGKPGRKSNAPANPTPAGGVTP